MKTTKQKQDAFITSLMPDSDKRMMRITGASLAVALAFGFWASTYEWLVNEVIFETPPNAALSATVTMNSQKEVKK